MIRYNNDKRHIPNQVSVFKNGPPSCFELEREKEQYLKEIQTEELIDEIPLNDINNSVKRTQLQIYRIVEEIEKREMEEMTYQVRFPTRIDA